MSAAAIQLLDHLRESGMEDEQAVKIAEAFDRRVEEAMREAKSHSDRNRAESEEKAKSQFVTAEEYHKRDRTLATRDDLNTAIAVLRADNRADNAALRAEMSEIRTEVRATNRLILGGFITLFVAIVAGFFAIVDKLLGG